MDTVSCNLMGTVFKTSPVVVGQQSHTGVHQSPKLGCYELQPTLFKEW